MRPSSFFVGAGRRVPVMWVLAVDCPLAVDGGGAVLVGWMVIVYSIIHCHHPLSVFSNHDHVSLSNHASHSVLLFMSVKSASSE